MPDGHTKGSTIAPLPFVNRFSVRKAGTGIRVPPLKGVGVLASDMNRTAAEDGRANVSERLPAEPAASVPVPARCGTPLTPASPAPTSENTGVRTTLSRPASVVGAGVPFWKVIVVEDPVAMKDVVNFFQLTVPGVIVALVYPTRGPPLMLRSTVAGAEYSGLA